MLFRSSVRVTCPICHSIFEFDPATECDKEGFKAYRNGQQYIERTVTCPCCHKSFIAERNYSWRARKGNNTVAESSFSSGDM